MSSRPPARPTARRVSEHPAPVPVAAPTSSLPASGQRSVIMALVALGLFLTLAGVIAGGIAFYILRAG